MAEDDKVPSLQEHISVTQRELLEEFPADAFANLSKKHSHKFSLTALVQKLFRPNRNISEQKFRFVFDNIDQLHRY